MRSPWPKQILSLKHLLCFAAILCAVSASAQTTASLPRRVVTLAPNLTESVFALGAGDRVVGVSDFCQYPPEARTRKRCGGEYTPNFETLVALNPDLIILEGKASKVRDFCAQRGIPVLNVTMNSVASVRQDLLTIGKRLGVEEAATSLTHQIDVELAATRLNIPEDKMPRVFVSIDRPEGAVGTLLTAGRGTFLDEMVAIAGGRNAFADRTDLYPRISKETLIRRRPDIILELRPGQNIDAARKARLMEDWAPLSSIPAVRNNKIIFLTEDFLLLSGPRMAQTAKLIRAALHPEIK